MDDLYQEIILDHYRNPRHKGSCKQCTHEVQQDNPMCGDEITLELELDGETLICVAHQGQGCSISQASASMMAEAIHGVTVARALELSQAMRRMMRGEPPLEDLGDLMALEGVARFPVRVKCALLPWTALREALEPVERQSSGPQGTRPHAAMEDA